MIRRLVSYIFLLSLFTMVFPAHADNLPKLYLYNWNNYISQDVVSQFEKECKCHVVQDYYSDNEEMLAKIASGAAGYDLIVPTGNAVESLIKQKELLPFDYSQLPNFHNIKPEFRGMWFDAKNQFSIPYAYTITLLGYNVEKMKALGIPSGKGETKGQKKEKLRAKAQQLFPELPIWKTPKTKGIQLAIADALLIAHYCRLTRK